jgi:hypothetical protein
LDFFISIYDFLESWIFAFVFPIILVLGIYNKIQKGFDLSLPLLVFKYILVFEATIKTVWIVQRLLFSDTNTYFEESGTGGYVFAFVMFGGLGAITYFALLSKYSKKYLVILFISLFLNFFFYRTKYIILSSSIHRDYESLKEDLTLVTFVGGTIIMTLIYAALFIIFDTVRNKMSADQSALDSDF